MTVSHHVDQKPLELIYKRSLEKPNREGLECCKRNLTGDSDRSSESQNPDRKQRVKARFRQF